MRVKVPFRIISANPKTECGRLFWIEALQGRRWETIGQIMAGTLKISLWS